MYLDLLHSLLKHLCIKLLRGRPEYNSQTFSGTTTHYLLGCDDSNKGNLCTFFAIHTKTHQFSQEKPVISHPYFVIISMSPRKMHIWGNVGVCGCVTCSLFFLLLLLLSCWSATSVWGGGTPPKPWYHATFQWETISIYGYLSQSSTIGYFWHKMIQS